MSLSVPISPPSTIFRHGHDAKAARIRDTLLAAIPNIPISSSSTSSSVSSPTSPSPLPHLSNVSQCIEAVLQTLNNLKTQQSTQSLLLKGTNKNNNNSDKDNDKENQSQSHFNEIQQSHIDRLKRDNGRLKGLVEEKDQQIMVLSAKERELLEKISQLEVEKETIEMQMANIMKGKSVSSSLSPSPSPLRIPLGNTHLLSPFPVPPPRNNKFTTSSQLSSSQLLPVSPYNNPNDNQHDFRTTYGADLQSHLGSTAEIHSMMSMSLGMSIGGDKGESIPILEMENKTENESPEVFEAEDHNTQTPQADSDVNPVSDPEDIYIDENPSPSPSPSDSYDVDISIHNDDDGHEKYNIDDIENQQRIELSEREEGEYTLDEENREDNHSDMMLEEVEDDEEEAKSEERKSITKKNPMGKSQYPQVFSSTATSSSLLNLSSSSTHSTSSSKSSSSSSSSAVSKSHKLPKSHENFAFSTSSPTTNPLSTSLSLPLSPLSSVPVPLSLSSPISSSSLLPITPSLSKKLISDFKRLRLSLLDNKQNWQKRMSDMSELSHLIRSYNVSQWDEWSDQLMVLRLPLGDQLTDLRSSIVKEACGLLVLIAKSDGCKFISEVNYYLNLLFKGLYVTIKVVSSACEEGMEGIVNIYTTSNYTQMSGNTNTSTTMVYNNDIYNKLLESLSNGMSDLHGVVREKCSARIWEILKFIMENNNNEENTTITLSSDLLDTLSSVIRTHIQDSDPATRQNVRDLYKVIAVMWTQLGTTLFGEFGTGAQKLILSELEKEKEKGKGKGKGKGGKTNKEKEKEREKEKKPIK